MSNQELDKYFYIRKGNPNSNKGQKIWVENLAPKTYKDKQEEPYHLV